jgi:hypothetical protein
MTSEVGSARTSRGRGKNRRFSKRILFELTPKQHTDARSLRVLDGEGNTVTVAALLRGAIVLMTRDAEVHAEVVEIALEEERQRASELAQHEVSETLASNGRDDGREDSLDPRVTDRGGYPGPWPM